MSWYSGNHYEGHHILCSKSVEAEFEITLMHKFVQSVASFQLFVYFQVGRSAVSKLMILKKNPTPQNPKHSDICKSVFPDLLLTTFNSCSSAVADVELLGQQSQTGIFMGPFMFITSVLCIYQQEAA